MYKIKKTLLIALTVLFWASASAQSRSTYEVKDVYNLKYGVTIYDKFNSRSSKKDVRLNKRGKEISGWVKDYYSHGALLHNGYYASGKLITYSNYHPNGVLERKFKMIDREKSKMLVYDRYGNLISKRIYLNNAAIFWEDYSSDGKVVYSEKFNKSLEYHLYKNTYFDNGVLESSMKLINKKRVIYQCSNYYPDGSLKESGNLHYNKSTHDYDKIGKWQYFNKEGSPVDFSVSMNILN